MKEIIFTKQNLQTIINAITDPLQEPSMKRAINVASSDYAFFGAVGWYVGNTPGALSLMAIVNYINDHRKFTIGINKGLFQNWLDSMNYGNFSEVKFRVNDPVTIASGVGYADSLPVLLGYKDSSGNWILPS